MVHRFPFQTWLRRTRASWYRNIQQEQFSQQVLLDQSLCLSWSTSEMEHVAGHEGFMQLKWKHMALWRDSRMSHAVLRHRRIQNKKKDDDTDCFRSLHPIQSRLPTGFPWWRSGWESACQCRGHGFEPWSGKIPHAAEQLGPWATTTEPVRLEPLLCNKRGRDSERPTHGDEDWPPLAATGESPCTETKTQHSQKWINK